MASGRAGESKSTWGVATVNEVSISTAEATSDSAERQALACEQVIMRDRQDGLKRVAAVASGLFGVGACVIIGAPVPAAVASTLAALTFVFLVIGAGGWVVVGHPFLLSPRYGPWIRTLEPFEPETFWGQSLQNLATWLGAVALLVLGGIIGADLSAQGDADRMLSHVWEWIGLLVVGGGVYVWWTSFIVKLATSHRRALMHGQLAVPPGAGSSVWLLFLVVWFAGVVVTVVLFAVAPVAWQIIT